MVARSPSGIFSYPGISRSLYRKALNNVLANVVKCCRGIRRGIINRSISAKDVQSFRRLHAVEGYVDLGMFQEAEEELRDLDPAWFALEKTRCLQLRALAGLDHCE